MRNATKPRLKTRKVENACQDQCQQRDQVTPQWFGFGPNTRLCSVPEPSINQTSSFLAGHTRNRTSQPAGFGGFGLIRLFQSAVVVFGYSYLWSYSDILWLCATYSFWYIIVFFGFIGCHHNPYNQTDAPCYILNLTVNNLLSYIISKIGGTEQSYCQLMQSSSRKLISWLLLLRSKQSVSLWRYMIVSKEYRNATSNFTS